MDGAFNFMMIFDIFIAVYLLYYAIKGSGKAYENDYPEEMQAAHRKLLRTLLFAGLPAHRCWCYQFWSI